MGHYRVFFSALSGSADQLQRTCRFVQICAAAVTPALSLQKRGLSTALPQTGAHVVKNFSFYFVKEELESLSIPADELKALAESGLSDAGLTAWALAKTRTHPLATADAASQRLEYLLSKLDSAMMRQHAASSSPQAELLWQVGVAAAAQDLEKMSQDDLEGCIEYQAAVAYLRRPSSSKHLPSALQLLKQQLPQLVDTHTLSALNHPQFWSLAQAAAGSSPSLAEDLRMLGYDVKGAASTASEHLQLVEQLLGLEASQLQLELGSHLGMRASVPLPQHHAELLKVAAGNTDCKTVLGRLHLLESLASVLGCTAVQLLQPASSVELVRRMTGRAAPPPSPSPELIAALQAAAPALVAAVGQEPPSQLPLGISGLMHLMERHPDLQALHKALTTWRAEAAAAGSVQMLTSLTQSEVSGLSNTQAEAVRRQVMLLEAQGRLLLRQAAAGQLDVSQLTPEETAALAWKAHTQQASAVEELVQQVLAQAARVTARHRDDASAAEEALSTMAVGFQLEEATSLRSTAAPPSRYLMAGFPQTQLSELQERVEGIQAGSTNADDTSGRLHSSASQLDAVEQLVRDLAALLAGGHRANSAGGPDVLAAAERLQVLSRNLPLVLSGPLLDLLAAAQPGAHSADAAAVRQRQQQLETFLRVLAAELPQHLGSRELHVSGGGNTWAASGQVVGDPRVAGGLLELLGEQDTSGLLRYAAEQEASRSDAKKRGGGEKPQDDDHLYGWLANIHHDQDMQRYLQIEFDSGLELDLVHTPRGWKDPDLCVDRSSFLTAMKPLLDTYLASQGEQPLQELEWQVYKEAALAETEEFEAEAAQHRQAAGHSPFYNSRADEAYLLERLEAGIPKSSVLYASARKYLAASFKNRSWRFAQRKRMVDVLIRIAAHLAAHPPRTHRGSPFSALFERDGPPLVPRISKRHP